MIGSVSNYLIKIKEKEVIFKENLSSHTKDDVFAFFEETIDRFSKPRFCSISYDMDCSSH